MIPLRDINPTVRFPLITVLFIVINIAVFLHQVMLPLESGKLFVAAYAFVPARLFFPAGDGNRTAAAIALITSQFLHGGVLHLAGNMLYLWIFGNNIEDAMSRVRFVLFYLLCGVAATCGHAFTNTASTVPLVGASGAISGVLGAYFLLFPRARVLTLIAFGFYLRTVAVPAVYVLGFWFVLQFFSALASPAAAGGVAWFAHIGGFIAGLVLIGLFKRRDIPFWGGRSYRYV